MTRSAAEPTHFHGLPVKMRLAMKTGIPSDKAVNEPDSPENLAKFYAAAKEVIGADVPQL